jgi:tetratricopeptide (TPR) repeat protein
MKRIPYILLALGLCLTACQSVTENIFEGTVGAEDYRKVEEIELFLLEFNVTGNTYYLDRAGEKLAILFDAASYNKEFEATLYGLGGEIEYYKNNKKGVEKAIETIELKSKREERLPILRAFLEPDIKKQIAILEAGLEQSSSTGHIHLLLAQLYFEAGDYRKSAAAFDDAFKLLSDNYKQYYQKKRDIAYQFIENPPSTIEASDLLALDTLTVGDVISITLLQTDFLDNITVNKHIDREVLLQRLKEKDYIHGKQVKKDDICRRKDIAYFLLAILSYLENNRDILEVYKREYERSEMPSPVPDLHVHDYYFNAVLVLVEREIMELPDGINFHPDDAMSGMEFNETLKRMKAYY